MAQPTTTFLNRLLPLGLAALVCLAPAAAPGIIAADPTSGPATHTFVRRVDGRLQLAGRPYAFTGLNIYNATSTTGFCWYPMHPGGLLNTALTSMGPGNEVFRAWFFQFEATRYEGAGSLDASRPRPGTFAGQRDWSSFDQTLALAKASGKRIIATLIDQWGACEGWPDRESGYKTEQWYRSGYRTQPTGPGLPATYRDWVREVVTRYSDDPTILAWQLVNEAEAGISLTGECSDTAHASLKAFVADVADLVKDIDRHHLISIGTIGSGQCGAANAEYQELHRVPEVDLCEYHDYDQPDKPVPGDEWNGMAVRLQLCRELGKPLFTGELGLKPGQSDGTLAGRAKQLDAKLRGQFGAGVVGVLSWAWRDPALGGSALDDYWIGPADPALATLASY
jgi:mannan endo-1,4-beta-mannosidase